MFARSLRALHKHFDPTNIRSKNCVLAMLYLVGLGLADETDITVRGLDVVRRATRVYLEAYTSILLVPKEKLVRIL